MAGRPMLPIPDDAPPALKGFIGELRGFVQSSVGEGGTVTQLAEMGPVSRSTFLGALSGQRMPSLNTVRGIIDSIAKYRAWGQGTHKRMLSAWDRKHALATRALQADPASATASAYDARVDTTSPVAVAEAVTRLLFDGVVREQVLTDSPKVSPVVFADALAGHLEKNPQLPPAEYPALVTALLEALSAMSEPEDGRLGLVIAAPEMQSAPHTTTAEGKLDFSVLAAAWRDPERRRREGAETPFRQAAARGNEDALYRLVELRAATPPVELPHLGATAGTTAPTVEEAILLLDGAQDRLEAASQEVARARTLLKEARDRAAAATAADAEPEPTSTVVQQLAGLPAEEQEKVLTDLVRHHAAAVLQHTDAEALRESDAFFEVGFDSLAALELRNRIGTATGLTLSAALLYDHPTPSAVAAHVRELLAVPAAR